MHPGQIHSEPHYHSKFSEDIFMAHVAIMGANIDGLPAAYEIQEIL